MKNRKYFATILLASSLAIFSLPVFAQPAWSPEKNVEIIVPSAAGGGLDRTARAVHQIWQDQKIVTAISTVVNKPGGSGTLSYIYLNQFKGNGHYISISSPTLLTNHILGIGQLGPADFTPIAQLSSEYLLLMVNAGSPLKNGQEIIERLRKDPSGLSIAIGSVRGGANHIGIGRILKAGGIDVKKLKVVLFKSGTESVTAVMGGHVDLSINAPEQALPLIAGGKLRAIAIGSPNRLTGAFANVPTWKEFGIDVVTDTWRGVVAPKDLSQSQIAYWDMVFSKLTSSKEWQAVVDKHHWVNNYMNSAKTRQFLESDYQEQKADLTELGLAKLQ